MEKKYKDSKFYKIIRPIVKFIFITLYRPKIIGKENIPIEGRIILAGNHTNNFDCIMLMSSTKRSIHFLAKQELFKGPKKIIFSNLGLIPVNRKIHDHRPIEIAEGYLSCEKVIGIFPEGTTRKPKGTLLPFKMGAVKMAFDTNTKIVPFCITGDYKIFSKNLKIVFCKPIKINDYLEKENNKLQSIISNMLKEGK